MLKSSNANGVRTSERGHAVEHAYEDRDFGSLRADASRSQAIARGRLEPVHQVLDKRAPVVTAALFPFGATGFRDRGNGLVAPACAERVLRPCLRPFARRDRGLGVARGDHRMGLLRVVRAVATDDFNRDIGGNLVEKIGQHAGVADILMGHQRPNKPEPQICWKFF